VSEVAAGQAGEFLHRLRDVLKQRRGEEGLVSPVPHWFAVSAWSKALTNRSQIPSEVRSSWNEKPGRRRKEQGSKGKALGHLLSPLTGLLSERLTDCHSAWDCEKLLHWLRRTTLVGKRWGESNDLLPVSENKEITCNVLGQFASVRDRPSKVY